MIKAASRTREIVANIGIIRKKPLLPVAILAIFYFLILFAAFHIFQVFRYSTVQVPSPHEHALFANDQEVSIHLKEKSLHILPREDH